MPKSATSIAGSKLAPGGRRMDTLSKGTGTRFGPGYRDYANSSLITLPLLAIFIGRPLLLVKGVSSEMPRALQTEAITCCDVYGSVSTLVPSSLVLPTAMPPFMPPPPTITLHDRAQWSRPALPLIRGVRLNSPIQMMAV